MYNAADRDRQQQLAEKQARLEAMTNGIKTGATLLGTAAAGPLGGWIGNSVAGLLGNRLSEPGESPNIDKDIRTEAEDTPIDLPVGLDAPLTGQEEEDYSPEGSRVNRNRPSDSIGY